MQEPPPRHDGHHQHASTRRLHLIHKHTACGTAAPSRHAGRQQACHGLSPPPVPPSTPPHLCRQVLQAQPLGGLHLATQLGHQGGIPCSSGHTPEQNEQVQDQQGVHERPRVAPATCHAGNESVKQAWARSWDCIITHTERQHHCPGHSAGHPMLLTWCLLLGSHQPPLHLADFKLLGFLEGLHQAAATKSARHLHEVGDTLPQASRCHLLQLLGSMVRPLGLCSPPAAAAAKVSSGITQRLAACKHLTTCQQRPSAACAASMLAPAVGFECWFCAGPAGACKQPAGLRTDVCGRGLFCLGLSVDPPATEAMIVPRLDQDCTGRTCSFTGGAAQISGYPRRFLFDRPQCNALSVWRGGSTSLESREGREAPEGWCRHPRHGPQEAEGRELSCCGRHASGKRVRKRLPCAVQSACMRSSELDSSCKPSVRRDS